MDQGILREAGSILRSGGLVAFPTETVYGLGANALDGQAAEKTYRAKGRPSDNPLIVHIAEIRAMETLAQEVPRQAYALAEAFWPGPLTLILPKNPVVPYSTTGGLDTVAVRMPDHPVALALIREGGGYVSAPSANTSGRPSPTTAEHVLEDLDARIDLVLDGGPVEIGVESTILDLTQEVPVILRPGAITQEMLETVVGTVRMDEALLSEDTKAPPKAPGMKYRHYAPRAEMLLVEGTPTGTVKAIRQLAHQALRQGRKVGILASEETWDAYEEGFVKVIGTRERGGSVAQGLYRILREFDRTGVEVIYSETFPREGIGSAVMNRLEKAASHRWMRAEEILKRQRFHSLCFISQTDTAEGPMAAAILRRQDLREDYRIFSRGLVVLFPEPLNPKSEVVLGRHGYTLPEHVSKPLDPEEIEADTLVLTMDPLQKQKLLYEMGVAGEVYTLQEFLGRKVHIDQPLGEPLEAYEDYFRGVEDTVKALAEKLNEFQKEENI